MAQKTKLERARESVREERKWIEEHGRDVSGYVARYGDSDAPYGKRVEDGGRYGEGGQRIYEADMDALRQYEAELAKLEKRRGTQTALGL